MQIMAHFINVREANTIDIPLINEILRHSKAYWGYEDSFMEAFMNKFSLDETYLKQYIVKVVCLEGQVIGFFSFIYEKEKLELDYFFLHPRHIGKGYGKKAWDACCAFARELNVSEVTLISDPNAETFYQKMGCKKIGNKESPFIKGRYLPVMRYVFVN